MKVVFIPTIPCSGTFFVSHLLRGNANMALRRIHEFEKDDDSTLRSGNGFILLHSHPVPLGYEVLANCWFQKNERIERWLDLADHIVMPMRDPIRNALTAQVCRYFQKPSYTNYLVDCYLSVCCWNNSHKINFIPVDLLSDVSSEERFTFVRELVERVDLPANVNFLKRFADNWTVYNHRIHGTASEPIQSKPLADDDIRKAYPTDMERVQKCLPEWDYLMKHRDTLRTLLEPIGYQNLPWWN